MTPASNPVYMNYDCTTCGTEFQHELQVCGNGGVCDLCEGELEPDSSFTILYLVDLDCFVAFPRTSVNPLMTREGGHHE